MKLVSTFSLWEESRSIEGGTRAKLKVYDKKNCDLSAQSRKKMKPK